MSDLISRQALLDKFEPWLKVKDYNDGELNMLKAILYEIRFMRSAEPKKGKWIKSGRWGRVYKCNQCGNFLDFDGVNAGRGDANYCPNCGAKMEVTT